MATLPPDSMRKSLTFKTLDLNVAQGVFTGYAAVFSNEDLVGDVIERGAFAQTLREASETKARTGAAILFPLLWMHNRESPIGAVLSAREDAKGLLIEAQCDLDTRDGRDVFSGIAKGYSTGLSIGYDTVKATRDAKGVRHLREIRLWEVSIVTSGFAANPLATADVASVKSLRGRDVDEAGIAQLAAGLRAWRRAHFPQGDTHDPHSSK